VVEGLDHVQLACPAGGEDEARRFYGELLGLREIEKPEPLRSRGGVWFECGPSQQLHLGVEEPFAPARKAHPALLVASPEALTALAATLGDVTWDTDLPGYKRFYVSDPFGNRLELLSRTGATTTTH
jgi:catechol 2,3-dioxygenase-like lactoylglutathione lyase family enzyme